MLRKIRAQLLILRNYIVSVVRSWFRFEDANSAKITVIYFSILYSVQTATIFNSQKDWERAISTLFIIFGFVLLNKEFLKNLFLFISKKKSIRNIRTEFYFIVAMGLTNIVQFACLYRMYGVKDATGVVSADWMISFYFSIVTWTTLGYGDFVPVPELRLVSAFEALLGYTYMALLIGLFLSHADYLTRKYEPKKTASNR